MTTRTVFWTKTPYNINIIMHNYSTWGPDSVWDWTSMDAATHRKCMIYTNNIYYILRYILYYKRSSRSFWSRGSSTRNLRRSAYVISFSHYFLFKLLCQKGILEKMTGHTHLTHKHTHEVVWYWWCVPEDRESIIIIIIIPKTNENVFVCISEIWFSVWHEFWRGWMKFC